MCIDHKEVGQFKCCSCMPLTCGIVTIFVLEICGLYVACVFGNLFGILTSCAILIGFILSYFMRENMTIRYSLCVMYAFTLASFILYMIIFLSTTSLDTIVYNVCQAINSLTTQASSSSQSARDLTAQEIQDYDYSTLEANYEELGVYEQEAK